MKKLILTMALLASAQSFGNTFEESANGNGTKGVTSSGSLFCTMHGNICYRNLQEAANEINTYRSTGQLTSGLIDILQAQRTENPLLKDASDETVIRILELLINVEIK